jgi:OPA family glycerol-3-phosphate transporter-like MFS transporter
VDLSDAGAQRAPAPIPARQIVVEMIRTPRLRWAAATCLFASTVKDGLSLWAPTFLVDALGLSLQRAALAASILPLLGLGGSLLAGWSSDRFFQSRETPGIVALSAIVGLAMVGFLWLASGGPLWMSIALLGLCGAAVYGINSLLLTSLPLSFGDGGHVGAVAGFLDFSSYVGGGISALVVGQIIAGPGWHAVFVYWLGTTIVAAGSAVVLGRSTAAK